jgi:hypothetical protein
MDFHKGDLIVGKCAAYQIDPVTWPGPKPRTNLPRDFLHHGGIFESIELSADS